MGKDYRTNKKKYTGLFEPFRHLYLTKGTDMKSKDDTKKCLSISRMCLHTNSTLFSSVPFFLGLWWGEKWVNMCNSLGLSYWALGVSLLQVMQVACLAWLGFYFPSYCLTWFCGWGWRFTLESTGNMTISKI